jgi:hypothetical protein
LPTKAGLSGDVAKFDTSQIYVMGGAPAAAGSSEFARYTRFNVPPVSIIAGKKNKRSEHATAAACSDRR